MPDIAIANRTRKFFALLRDRIDSHAGAEMARSIRAEIRRDNLRNTVPLMLEPRPRPAGQIVADPTHVRTFADEFAEVPS